MPGGAGGRQRAQGGLRAAVQRAHEIAVETVEKKSLSPFNDKVYGLDAHNSRPLGHWARSGTAAAAEPLLGVDSRSLKKRKIPAAERYATSAE